MFRSPRSRTAAAASIALSLLLGLLHPARADVTGKLSGRVVDDKGAPLVGVNIRIEGQRLGAISDEKGDYFILAIPAGTYRVIANRMDLAPFSAENVTISPDFTTNLNVTMRTQAIQQEE